jgi:polar amino acid transport system substrate-binding protein
MMRRFHKATRHLVQLSLVGILCVANLFPTKGAADTFTVVSDVWEGYTAPDGTGYWFELIRLVYEPLGHTLEFRTVPYPRALDEIRKGKSQITPATYRGDLDDSHTELSIVIEQDSVDAFITEALAADWRGVESLTGKRVVARLDYGYDRFLPAGVLYEEKPYLEGMLKMLALGRVDAVLDYEEEMNALRQAGSVSMAWVTKTDVLQPVEYAAFALTPEGLRARDIFRTRMREIIRDNLAAPLMQKYQLPDRYRPFVAPTGHPTTH